ncbi:MAG: hypothetical protein KDC66_08405 [Phaeodactylibacter sp.]|nr:hypothetical protein [Phaeodactylibacter sp.]MCB9274013.1 hypothetical protein [Lewinellaceae bacterium]
MKSFLLIGTLLSFTSGIFAQTYNEAIRPMSQGENNSFVVELKVGDAKTIGELWQDYQKKFKAGKPKLDKKTKEYFADDAEIEGISDNTIDIYSTITPRDGKGAMLAIWFDLGGAYLSSSRHPDRISGARQWMAGFEKIVGQEFAAQALEAEVDALKALEKELKGLEKEKGDKEDRVADLEKELQQARTEAGQAAQAVSNKEQQIEEQKKVIEAAKAKLKKGKG